MREAIASELAALPARRKPSWCSATSRSRRESASVLLRELGEAIGRVARRWSVLGGIKADAECGAARAAPVQPSRDLPARRRDLEEVPELLGRGARRGRRHPDRRGAPIGGRWRAWSTGSPACASTAGSAALSSASAAKSARSSSTARRARPERPASRGPPDEALVRKRGTEEIRGDRALRIYAAALALVHPLTALFWLLSSRGVPATLGRGGTAICWAFHPSCGEHRLLGETGWSAIAIGYGALGTLAAALWIAGRARVAWPLHLVLELVKVAIVVQDFRLRLNRHYMALFAAAAFLLLPRRRDTARVLIVVFYVWAGALKLDPEWLSGAALYRQPWLVPLEYTAEACLYVVVLEIAFSWGLLARSAAIFWGTFAQIVLFHVVSFGSVGPFYPLLMFLLIAIFPLARAHEGAAEPNSRDGLLARLFTGGVGAPAYALVALFSLLQLVPRLFPGDSALTGEGRFVALHMFDARIECQATIVSRYADGGTRQAALALEETTRSRCDPLVVWQLARAECRRLAGEPGFRDFDLTLDSRRSTELADPVSWALPASAPHRRATTGGGTTSGFASPARASRPPRRGLDAMSRFYRVAWIFYLLLAMAGLGGLVALDRRIDLALFVRPESWWLDLALGLGVGVALLALWSLLRWKSERARELERTLGLLVGPLATEEIVALAVVSAIGEEVAFRGALQGWLGLVPAALLFALLHVGPDPAFRPWTLSPRRAASPSAGSSPSAARSAPRSWRTSWSTWCSSGASPEARGSLLRRTPGPRAAAESAPAPGCPSD